MNISSDALADWNGSAAEDRPDYVDEALAAKVRVGRGFGKPVVAPPGGRDSDLHLGDSGDYSHYLDRDEIIRPGDDVKAFLSDLFDAVNSISDASDETNIPEDRLETAADLHGIDTPDGGEGASTDTQVDAVELPSGEQIPPSILDEPVHGDKVVLSALASMGMSTDEITRYLAEQGFDADTHSVRQECRRHNLLDGQVQEHDRDRREYTVESGASIPVSRDKTTVERVNE